MFFLGSSKGEDVISISLFLGFFTRTLGPLTPWPLLKSLTLMEKIQNKEW
jgi:hypothetical protein